MEYRQIVGILLVIVGLVVNAGASSGLVGLVGVARGLGIFGGGYRAHDPGRRLAASRPQTVPQVPRIGDCSMAYEMPQPSAPDVGIFLDNADPGRTLSQHLQQAMPAAQRLCICTGYVSVKGLRFLAEWLDPMDPQAEAQLLIGMPPTGWKYPPSTAAAGATYIRRHIGAGEGPLDLEVWQRLAAQEEAGRLALRLRAPFHAMRAKLYLWQTAAGRWQGVSGSSNLTHSGLTGPGELNTILTAERAHWACSWFQTHWQAPPSRRAPRVWVELGADGQPEITVETPRANWPPETEIIEEEEVIEEGEIIEEEEVIVPAPGVPARRGLATAFEGNLGSMEYRVIGAVLLFVIGALAAFGGGWWVVGIGLMILATVVLPGGRRGRRRRRRSRG